MLAQGYLRRRLHREPSDTAPVLHRRDVRSTAPETIAEGAGCAGTFAFIGIYSPALADGSRESVLVHSSCISRRSGTRSSVSRTRPSVERIWRTPSGSDPPSLASSLYTCSLPSFLVVHVSLYPLSSLLSGDLQSGKSSSRRSWIHVCGRSRASAVPLYLHCISRSKRFLFSALGVVNDPRPSCLWRIGEPENILMAFVRIEALY